MHRIGLPKQALKTDSTPKKALIARIGLTKKNLQKRMRRIPLTKAFIVPVLSVGPPAEGSEGTLGSGFGNPRDSFRKSGAQAYAGSLLG